MSEKGDEGPKSKRWQRRESRQTSERSRIAKHGASLRRVYIDAVKKRAKAGKQKPD